MEMLIALVLVAVAMAYIAFPGRSTRVDPEAKYRDVDLAPDDNEYSVVYQPR